MKGVVPGPNLIVFGRAIHSLAKIGDEIYFEATNDGLSVGTVNSARCAYMSFKFGINFFQKYSLPSKSKSQRDKQESIKCKVYTKSCLAVFKSLANLEKTADKCVILLDMEEDRFVFQLHCKHGLVKTFNLTFIESERLDAIFSVEDCPNIMIVRSKLFGEVVNNFQPNSDEINLHLFQDRAIVTNHAMVLESSSNFLRTEVTLQSEEFDEFHVVSDDMQMIFCLKEFRAFLYFCEGPDLQFTMHIKEPGEPIIFTVDTDPAFDAHLVLSTVSLQQSMATMTTKDATMTARKRVETPASSKFKERKEKKDKKRVLFDVSNSRDDGEAGPMNINNESHFINDVTLIRDDDGGDDDDEDDDDHRNENRVTTTPMPSNSRQQESSFTQRSHHSTQISSDRNISRPANSSAAEDAFVNRLTPSLKRKARSNDDGGDFPLARDKSRSSNSREEGGNVSRKNKVAEIFQSLVGDDDDDDQNEDDVANIATMDPMTEDHKKDGDDDDDDDDVIPGTPPDEPPNKRFRSLFFGLSQSQEASSSQSSAGSQVIAKEYEVLVEDSEDDS